MHFGPADGGRAPKLVSSPTSDQCNPSAPSCSSSSRIIRRYQPRVTGAGQKSGASMRGESRSSDARGVSAGRAYDTPNIVILKSQYRSAQSNRTGTRRHPCCRSQGFPGRRCAGIGRLDCSSRERCCRDSRSVTPDRDRQLAGRIDQDTRVGSDQASHRPQLEESA